MVWNRITEDSEHDDLILLATFRARQPPMLVVGVGGGGIGILNNAPDWPDPPPVPPSIGCPLAGGIADSLRVALGRVAKAARAVTPKSRLAQRLDALRALVANQDC